MSTLPATPSDRSKEAGNQLVFSYLTLRNLIGLCGLCLPFTLAIHPSRPGAYDGFEPSISDYFYTDRGDLLVVILGVLCVFLFTYTGYTWKERTLTAIAAICGLGVAFVPTQRKDVPYDNAVHTNNGSIFHNHLMGIHLVLAGIFLICLAVMSLRFFTLTDGELRYPDHRLTQKGKRNRVYKWCGWIMIASVSILGVYILLKHLAGLDLKTFPIILLFETIAVVAFGISWLTKGETLWPDGQHYLVTFKNRLLGKA